MEERRGALNGTNVPDTAAARLGGDLRRRRRALGLSQVDLAELAGVSERFVRLVESGKASVRLDKLNAVLIALGMELRAEVRST